MPRLLLVDDNPVFLRLLAGLVHDHLPDAALLTAATGSEALDRLILGDVDLCLLDYRLPDLDGLEVLAELRQRGVGTAVIMVTGEGDEQVAADLFRMGAWDYLVKGQVDGEAVRRALDLALVRLNLHQQIASQSDELQTTSRQLEERSRALEGAHERLKKRTRELQELSESLEATVRERTEALAATTGFLEQVLRSSSSHAIFAADRTGRLGVFNLGAERAFGLPASEALGRPAASLFEADDAEPRLRSAHAPEGIELRARRLPGGVFPMLVRADPLADGGFVAVGRDITSERALEEENARYIQRIEQANRDLVTKNREILEAQRLKSQFTANISHELRTPLNAVIGYADLLTAGVYGPLAPRQTAAVEGIGARARDLLELIDNLLDMARLEAGGFDAHRERFVLGELLAEVVDTTRVLAASGPLEVRWEDHGARDLTLHTDRRQLRQILFNLVQNAVKFTERGTILLESRPGPDAGVELAVEDTGIGIPPDLLEAVFEEFRQVDGTSTRRHGGAGLGLSISRRFARALGGDLGLTSALGRGSRFVLRLPAVVVDP